MAFDNMYFSLAAVVLVIGIIYFIIAFSFEYRWTLRQNIEYSNFSEFKKYFEVSGVKRGSIFPIVYLLIVVGAGVSIYRYPEFYSYYFLLGLGLLLVGFGSMMYLSKRRYNKDISLFNKDYLLIKKLYSNRDNMQDNIDMYQSLLLQFQKNDLILADKISQLVSNDKLIDFKDSHNIIEVIIEEYNKMINGFDATITNRFTQSLRSYIKDGIFNSVRSSTDLEMTYTKTEVSKLVIEKQKEIIFTYFLESIQNNELKNDESIIEIINLLIELEIEIKPRFIEFSIDLANRNESIRMPIFKNEQFLDNMNNEIVYDALLVKQYTWLYDYKVIRFLTDEQILDVCININEKNLTDKVFLVISQLNFKPISFFKMLLTKLKIENQSKEKFISYLRIYEYLTLPNINISKRSEELYMILEKFAQNSNDDKLQEQMDLIKKSGIEKSFTIIENVYNNISNHQIELRDISSFILINFMDSLVSQNLLEKNAVLETFQDFSKNLMEREMHLLNLIILKVTLSNETNDEIKVEMMKLLSGLIKITNLPIKVGSNMSSDLIVKEIDKFIKNVSNRDIVINIINRIEKERLLAKTLIFN